MGLLLRYELKKMIRRPFTIVVAVGCVVVVLFANFYAASQTYVNAWGPEKYGSYDAIPEKELARAHEDFSLTGEYDGTLVYFWTDAIAMEKKATEPFSGLWDDARLAQMAADYQAFINDPAIYTDQLDEWAMQFRAWSLSEQGMSPEDIAAYDAANPLYLMKPEPQYGDELLGWYTVRSLLEEYVIAPDGSARTMAEAFPLVQAPALFEYHAGPRFATEVQGVLVGVLGLLMLLAGVSPVFSEEVACHTEPMLLAAKYGRDRLVRTKLLAGLLFAVASAVAFTALNVLCSGLAYGFEGWAVPIQLNTNTASMPYALTYWQYLLVQLGFELLGLCAMAALLMLLSAVLRSAIPVVFTGGLFSVVVILVANQAGGSPRTLAQLLPPGAVVPGALLYEGTRPGLGFLPLAQWVLAIVVCLALAVGAVVFVLRRYRRLQKT